MIQPCPKGKVKRGVVSSAKSQPERRCRGLCAPTETSLPRLTGENGIPNLSLLGWERDLCPTPASALLGRVDIAEEGIVEDSIETLERGGEFQGQVERDLLDQIAGDVWAD
jgi:hypothetical protein